MHAPAESHGESRKARVCKITVCSGRTGRKPNRKFSQYTFHIDDTRGDYDVVELSFQFV